MKTFKHFLALVLLVVLAMPASAQTSSTPDEDEALRQRINDAVMGVYNDHLAKDPNDYNTLHMRAGQYLNFGEVDAALTDINRAIELTPKKEKETLLDELLLRASIYDVKGNYQGEIEDLRQAAEISPSSPAVVEMMANVALKTGDYDNAGRNYQALLRQDARNYRAMYGLAQVEVKHNNLGEALTWVDRAIELYPANPVVYLNKASVLEQMNQPTAAAQTYLIAMASTDDNGASIQRLFDLSDRNYNEVMTVLRQATDQAPRVGIFYRIRSSIAIKHLHYGQALKDLNSLIDNDIMRHDAIYSDAALCNYHLTNFDAALAAIDQAIALNSTDALYHVQRGEILAALNRPADAISAFDRAIELDGKNYPDAFLGKARVYINDNDNEQALAEVNNALAAAPAYADARLLRVWLNKNRLNRPADDDINLMLNYGDDGSNMYSLRGFALYEAGRNDEARAWAQQIIDKGILPGGETYFFATALLAKIGDTDKAMQYWASALANGYGSRYEAKVNTNPYVNLAPLRSAAANYDIILEQNASNFDVQ